MFEIDFPFKLLRRANFQEFVRVPRIAVSARELAPPVGIDRVRKWQTAPGDGLAQNGPGFDRTIFGQAARRVERRLRSRTSEKGKILAAKDGEESLCFRHIFAFWTTIVVPRELVKRGCRISG